MKMHRKSARAHRSHVEPVDVSTRLLDGAARVRFQFSDYRTIMLVLSPDEAASLARSLLEGITEK